MRRPSSLTSSDRWELGLLMAMFIAGFLCLAAIWQSGGLNRVLAFASGTFSSSPATPQEIPTINVQVPDPAEPATPAAPLDPSSLGRAQQLQNNNNAPDINPSSPAINPAPAKPQISAAPKTPKPVDIRWYNGKRYKYLKTMRMRVTGYAPDIRCTWPYPGTTTASGLSVKTNKGRLVAADTRVIPMHSLVAIPGYHNAAPVPVLDRGGAIKGSRLDLLFPTYEQAQSWGVKYVNVKIYAPLDDDD